jgi:hypothetical protein
MSNVRTKVKNLMDVGRFEKAKKETRLVELADFLLPPILSMLAHQVLIY